MNNLNIKQLLNIIEDNRDGINEYQAEIDKLNNKINLLNARNEAAKEMVRKKLIETTGKDIVIERLEKKNLDLFNEYNRQMKLLNEELDTAEENFDYDLIDNIEDRREALKPLQMERYEIVARIEELTL